MKYYIGETADVEARLLFHNAGRQRSTKSRIPFEIIFIEEFETRQLTLIREKEIKSWIVRALILLQNEFLSKSN